MSVFGQHCYLVKDLVAYNQAKFHHPTTFSWRDIAFRIWCLPCNSHFSKWPKTFLGGVCASKITTIGWDTGLSPGQRQAIAWTNAGILLIGLLGINFNKILIEIHTFSFKKILFKMSSRKWRPFCLGLLISTRKVYLKRHEISRIIHYELIWISGRKITDN